MSGLYTNTTHNDFTIIRQRWATMEVYQYIELKVNDWKNLGSVHQLVAPVESMRGVCVAQHTLSTNENVMDSNISTHM